VSFRSDCHVQEVETLGSQHLIRVGVERRYAERLRHLFGPGAILVAQSDDSAAGDLFPRRDLELAPEPRPNNRKLQVRHTAGCLP